MNYERFGLMAFSGDSRTLALSTDRLGTRLLDLASMTDIAILEDNDDQRPLGYSRDGSQLVTFGSNGTFRLWDLRLIRAQLKEIGLDWGQPSLPPTQAAGRVDLTLAETKPATQP